MDIKKLFLVTMLFMMSIFTVSAVPNADFFSQTPVLTSYNATTGVGQIDFDVDTQGANLIEATVELQLLGVGPVYSEVFTGLGARDGVTFNFDLPVDAGNLNGDYYALVILRNEDAPAEHEVNQDVVFSFANGVDPAVGGTLVDTTGQLPQVGSDIGSFLSNLAPGVVAFIFILSIVGGIIGLFAAVVAVIKNSMKKGKK